jgi:hypothetical protein
MERMRALRTDKVQGTHLRRHHRVRISAPFPCSFVLVGLHRRLAIEPGTVGVVYDVSSKGARMMTEAVISPGDRIALSLQLPHHASPTVVDVATVRWGKAQTYGVEFEGLSPATDTRLQIFMARSLRPTPALVP